MTYLVSVALISSFQDKTKGDTNGLSNTYFPVTRIAIACHIHCFTIKRDTMAVLTAGRKNLLLTNI